MCLTRPTGQCLTRLPITHSIPRTGAENMSGRQHFEEGDEQGLPDQNIESQVQAESPTSGRQSGAERLTSRRDDSLRWWAASLLQACSEWEPPEEVRIRKGSTTATEVGDRPED